MELSHIIPILSLHCPHNFTIVFPMWSPSSSHTIYSNGSNACIHDAPRHLLEELHQSQQQGNMITCPIQRGIWHIFLGEILGISYWNGGIRHFFWICFLGRLGIGTWNRKLVGGFKHFLFSMSYMGCHPSHWLSYFSRWLLHHQTVLYGIPFLWSIPRRKTAIRTFVGEDWVLEHEAVNHEPHPQKVQTNVCVAMLTPQTPIHGYTALDPTCIVRFYSVLTL